MATATGQGISLTKHVRPAWTADDLLGLVIKLPGRKDSMRITEIDGNLCRLRELNSGISFRVNYRQVRHGLLTGAFRLI